MMVEGHSLWVFSMSVLMLMLVVKDAFNCCGSLWLVSMKTPQGGAFTDPDIIMEYMRMCPAKFWGVIKSHGALKMKTVVAACECFPSVASCSSGGDALANPYIAKLWWWSFPSWGRFSPTWTSAKCRHIKIGFTRPRYSSYFNWLTSSKHSSWGGFFQGYKYKEIQIQWHHNKDWGLPSGEKYFFLCFIYQVSKLDNTFVFHSCFLLCLIVAVHDGSDRGETWTKCTNLCSVALQYLWCWTNFAVSCRFFSPCNMNMNIEQSLMKAIKRAGWPSSHHYHLSSFSHYIGQSFPLDQNIIYD